MGVEGHKVVLAANSGWNIVHFRSGLVRALGEAGYEVIAVTPGAPQAADRITSLGIRHLTVSIERSGLNPITDLTLFLQYRNLLRQIRPAALLSFTIKPNIYACLAARTLGIPAIANVTGLGTLFIKPGLLTKLAIAMYRGRYR